MIPIRADDRGGFALLTVALALTMSGVALLQTMTTSSTDEIFRVYGLVPARLTSQESWSMLGVTGQVSAFFTYAFVHTGLLHALTNIWFCFVFGRSAERRLGTIRYAIAVPFLIVTPALLDVWFRGPSVVPIVGASGLVSGVMGVYLAAYPRGQVLTLVPFAVPLVFRARGWVFMAAWVGLQLVLAYTSPKVGATVAWWTHLGGFLFGLLAGRLLLPNDAVDVLNDADQSAALTMGQTRHE